MKLNIIKYRFGFFVFSFICLINAVAQFFVIYKGFGIIIWEAIIDSSIYNTVFWVLSFGLWYPIKYIKFSEKRLFFFLINHLLTGIATSFVWTYSGYYFISSLNAFSEKYVIFLNSSLNWRISIGIFYYGIAIAFFYLYKFNNDLRMKDEKEKELQLMIKEAELKSLKYQINPHFIFNSLNSISSLIITDSEKAKEMTLLLSDYMRNIFTKRDTPFVQLKDELENINLYLAIEKVRFRDKFNFTYDCKSEYSQFAVPHMILQPIFENIIKHAVHETVGKINILFECKNDNGFLKLKIENDIEPDVISRKGSGLGLENISNRLKLIYGLSNLFTYKKENDKFIVEIKIPVQHEK
jgi:sensor histidine kinase YesM